MLDSLALGRDFDLSSVTEKAVDSGRDRFHHHYPHKTLQKCRPDISNPSVSTVIWPVGTENPVKMQARNSPPHRVSKPPLELEEEQQRSREVSKIRCFGAPCQGRASFIEPHHRATRGKGGERWTLPRGPSRDPLLRAFTVWGSGAPVPLPKHIELWVAECKFGFNTPRLIPFSTMSQNKPQTFWVLYPMIDQQRESTLLCDVTEPPTLKLDPPLNEEPTCLPLHSTINNALSAELPPVSRVEQ